MANPAAEGLPPRNASAPSLLGETLATALPNSVLFPRDGAAFKKAAHRYWAQQEAEVTPACVIKPRNVEELCEAVKILNLAASGPPNPWPAALFAVRAGGHSQVQGAASIEGGTLIDLSLFNDVTPSEDGASVDIGAGVRWGEVSKVLDAKGLAVVGGRNSDVGVAGLALGGGLSFFSPRFGLACSNIISYQVVLASGSVVTASESSHPDLWRALKGGVNNFGIVTQLKARTFPQAQIWGGFLYMPSFQTAKIISTFHEIVGRVGTASYDEYAAGPLISFTYAQAIRTELVAVNLVYTKVLDNEKGWPAYWKTSGFSTLWRLWSDCKTRTLTNATDALEVMNPPGARQGTATLTITNDIPTMTTAHTEFRKAAASLRRAGVTGLMFSFIIQPFLPEWTRKGDPNPMGLHDGGDQPLVNVSFAALWKDPKHDELVKASIRNTTEKIEAAAVARGTAHQYKYLNYCGEWQKPLHSYGEDGLRLLKEVSRKYDPDRMFQRQCIGGFKLDMDSAEA